MSVGISYCLNLAQSLVLVIVQYISGCIQSVGVAMVLETSHTVCCSELGQVWVGCSLLTHLIRFCYCCSHAVVTAGEIMSFFQYPWKLLCSFDPSGLPIEWGAGMLYRNLPYLSCYSNNPICLCIGCLPGSKCVWF